MSQVHSATEFPAAVCHANGPRHVCVVHFALLSDYSERAVAHGIWHQGREYRSAPDGIICIDLSGHQRWVEPVRG